MDKKIDAQAFEAFAVKALKLTAEDLASLYNEAGELTDFSILEKKDAERISKLASDKTNQYNRGLKEASLKLEKELKEKFDVDSDLIGVELVDHIFETKLAEIKGASPEDVLKHPDVIKALNEREALAQKALKAKDKELAEKLKAKEDEINSQNLFKEIESNAIAEFESLNPILPEDPKKAKALKDILINDLKKYKHQKVGDTYVVLKEDGTPLQDDHAYNVSFQDHVKSIAEKYFDFKVAEDRSSSGNKPVPENQPKVRVPKDKADYVKMMGDNTLTPEDRVAIMNAAVQAKVINI